jgi:hypothetical protein
LGKVLPFLERVFEVAAGRPRTGLHHEKDKDYFKLCEYHAAQIAENLM